VKVKKKREEDALVDRLERTGDREVILELDSHTLVRERFEDGEDELEGAC
jgi:hypothetical protein